MRTLLTYIVWNVSPEIVSFGPITLRWYGLLFASAFLVGLFIVKRMFEKDHAPEEWLDKAFIYMVLGAVVGARLGHVFFYDWSYYSKHLGEIPKIWEGGLASHGGAIGIILALWIYSRLVTKRSVLWILDKVVVPTALGGVFIRMGNMMNSEIVGKPSEAGWAFQFPRNENNLWTECKSCIQSLGDRCLKLPDLSFREMKEVCVDIAQVPARHPVQLYEALSYLIIFVVLYRVYWKTEARQKPGMIFGAFLALLFTARFIMEFFKESQGGFETAFGNALSTGQLLSLPFVLAGLYFVFRPVARRSTEIENARVVEKKKK